MTKREFQLDEKLLDDMYREMGREDVDSEDALRASLKKRCEVLGESLPIDMVVFAVFGAAFSAVVSAGASMGVVGKELEYFLSTAREAAREERERARGKRR